MMKLGLYEYIWSPSLHDETRPIYTKFTIYFSKFVDPGPGPAQVLGIDLLQPIQFQLNSSLHNLYFINETIDVNYETIDA